MRITANGLAIEIDDSGPVTGEPLLLIMGLGMQLTAWPQEFVADLIAAGFRVIRMDNRDAGLSQGFESSGQPNMLACAMRYFLRLPVPSAYGLSDMALDATGVLDALGIERAHVCGASMGGMIAQHVGASMPGRVLSLALLMTSSGSRRLPQAKPHVRHALLKRPASHDQAAIVAHLEHLLHLIGSPAYRPDPVHFHEKLQESVQRAWRPSGTARQLVAVVADGDRTPILSRIEAPTLVLHGRADPLIPAAAATDLAGHIAGARLELVDGMGHDLPLQLLPLIAASIRTNADRVLDA